MRSQHGGGPGRETLIVAWEGLVIVPTKPKRNSATTKAAIVAAARKCFTSESYDHVTMRMLAAEAGCNTSLIARYFGSKAGLFQAAIGAAIPPPSCPDAALEVDRRLDCLLGVTNDLFDPSFAIFRSAGVSPANEIARDALDERFVAHLKRLIPGEDSELRAETVMAIFYGVNSCRNLLGMRSLSTAPREEVAALLRPLLLSLVKPAA